MNREYFEAIGHKSTIDMTLLIQKENDIYKDIIKELSERTCANCKYLIADEDDKEDIVCSEEEVANYLGAFGEYSATVPSKDFGCNKWESKDDK